MLRLVTAKAPTARIAAFRVFALDMGAVIWREKGRRMQV